jgi:hypothetical protein
LAKEPTVRSYLPREFTAAFRGVAWIISTAAGTVSSDKGIVPGSSIDLSNGIRLPRRLNHGRELGRVYRRRTSTDRTSPSLRLTEHENSKESERNRTSALAVPTIQSFRPGRSSTLIDRISTC